MQWVRVGTNKPTQIFTRIEIKEKSKIKSNLFAIVERVKSVADHN